jgi:hypothetical protein
MSQEQQKAAAFTNIPETDRSRLIAARRHGQSAQRDTATRDRAPDLGGVQLQMTVIGEIPGYHLYWANDENGYVERLLMEGFDFVTQDELYSKKTKVVEDLDISSCVSKYVKGMRVDGQPLRAYLMKCPDDVWARREEIRHSAADRWDQQIRRQAQEPDKPGGFYKPESVQTVVDPQYKKTYLKN